MLNTPEGDPTVEKHPRPLQRVIKQPKTMMTSNILHLLISVVYAFFFIFFFFFLGIAFMGIVSPLELKAKSNTQFG